jgi:cation transport regulator
MASAIKPISPNFKWLLDMMSLLSYEGIELPKDYRDQVLAVKDVLQSDESGMVNSILDFAVQAGSSVNYKIEASNPTVQETLNNWLYTINDAKRGKIPVGINALAKEYFRERWKGSSFLILRTVWGTVNGIELPTAMWFVDGEDIVEKSDKETVRIGEEKYYLRISKDKEVAIPARKDEMIFVQKPYSSWGSENTVPFIIQRGLYKNLKFLELLTEKGQLVVGKALEYLMMMKKGTEALAREGRAEFIYSQEDLEKAKTDFTKFMQDKKSNPSATSVYATNFDTDITHLIPDYQQAIKDELYTPIMKRIMSGLGLVEVIEGTASTRRESILNPKPFVNEVNTGISDFKMMLTDVLNTIVDKNKSAHKKYFSDSVQILDVNSSRVSVFHTKDLLDHLRSAYDRGQLSHETFIEEVCGMDYSIEVAKRKKEAEEGVDDVLYPHPVQYPPNLGPGGVPITPTIPNDNTPPDKKGPEAKNYNAATEELELDEVFLEEAYEPRITENYVRLRQIPPEKFDQDSFRTITISEKKGIKAVIGNLKGETKTTIQAYLFQKDKWSVKEAETWVDKHQASIEQRVYEEAPYKTIDDLPPNVTNVLPKEAQRIYMRVFNDAYPKGEDYARRVAWSVIKKMYKKTGDKWVKLSKGQIEEAFKSSDVSELIELKRLELLGKQNKLIDKLLEEGKADETSE